jgi:hypothetical protein
VERSRSEELIARLNRDGAALAARFGLRYRAIEAERPRVKRRYGVCYADGTIRIRLRHAATGKPLKYSSLVNTLCHELAHLKHFNHGLRFQSFYRQILEYARAARIYAPNPKARGGLVPSAPLAPRHAGLLPRRALAHDGTARRRAAPRPPEAPPRRPEQLTLF